MKIIILCLFLFLISCHKEDGSNYRSIYGDIKNSTNTSLNICIDEKCAILNPSENFSLKKDFDSCFFESSYFNPTVSIEFNTNPKKCISNSSLTDSMSVYFTWFDWKEDSTVYFRGYYEYHVYYSTEIRDDILNKATLCE